MPYWQQPFYMSCGGKYGMVRSKIQFVIKTVAYTEWSVPLQCIKLKTKNKNKRKYTTNSDVVSKPDKALGYASCLISFSTTSLFKKSRSILATVP